MHFCGGWDDLLLYGGLALAWAGTYWRLAVWKAKRLWR